MLFKAPIHNYCAYAHVVGDKIIYISHGTLMRAFATNARSQAWYAISGGAKNVTVYVLSLHEDADEAMLAAVRARRQHNPALRG